MKKLLIGLFILTVSIMSFSTADAYVRVKGYYRKDGTYVRPYVRSNPNGLKYDNYSWTPSQGLYNDTYGTRGSDWNTPTYITDPDYYEGKTLYESGQTESSGSLYVPTYTTPAAQTAPPALPDVSLFRGLTNSYVTTLQRTLAQDSSLYPEGIVSGHYGALTESAVRRFQSRYELPLTGIVSLATLEKFNQVYSGSDIATQKQTANVVPVNAYTLGSSWYCNTGYEKVGNTCEKVYAPANSYFLGSMWYCDTGYKKVADRCDKVIAPPNSYFLGSIWYCDTGYKKVSESCQKVLAPDNSYFLGSIWYCDTGYKKVDNDCQQVYKPANSYFVGADWYCNYGYQKVENSCQK